MTKQFDTAYNTYLAGKRTENVCKPAMQHVPIQIVLGHVKGKVDIEKITMRPSSLLGQREEDESEHHLGVIALLR